MNSIVSITSDTRFENSSRHTFASIEWSLLAKSIVS